MLAAPRGDPMQVSEKHLEFMMSKVFTFPRNTQFDKVRVEEKQKSISIISVSLGNEFQTEGKHRLLHLAEVRNPGLPDGGPAFQSPPVHPLGMDPDPRGG